jgi:hypothetical protein
LLSEFGEEQRAKIRQVFAEYTHALCASPDKKCTRNTVLHKHSDFSRTVKDSFRFSGWIHMHDQELWIIISTHLYSTLLLHVPGSRK